MTISLVEDLWAKVTVDHLFVGLIDFNSGGGYALVSLSPGRGKIWR